MAIGDDRKIIIRGVSRRAVETFLLVLGLALGIGASSAGIALVSRTIAASTELLSSPEYREIIVSTREDSTEMDTALVATDGDNDVVLTSIDLRAAEEAPDVRYAYIKQQRVFRNPFTLLRRAGRRLGQGAPVGPAPDDSAAASDDAIDGDAASDDATDGDASVEAPSEERPEGGFAAAARRLNEAQQEIGGPGPVLDEWYGYAVSPEFFEAWGLRAEAGSLFTLDDIASGVGDVMVLGSDLAKDLFDDGDVLGRRLVNFRSLTTITGVLAPTGTRMDSLAFVPAFMPDVTGRIESNEFSGMRMFWNSDLSFMVAEATRLDEAAAQLSGYFEREYGADAVVITVPREEAEATRDRNARLTTIILFLGVAGLFIAGVNVSNILLSRAMRRQKTVGILKALGASRNGIFRLFFTEALAIGIAGTGIGVGVSVALAGLMQRTIDVGRINPVMLAFGLGISWIVTTVLTVFPAMQAARIPAADAMRTE